MKRISYFSAAGLAALAACTETRPTDITGTQSLAVTLVSPADPGSVDNRLPDTARTVTVEVEARDEQNLLDPSLEGPMQVYTQFLGTLTPRLGGQPLTTMITLSAGRGSATFDLPQAFGPTVIWIDNGTGAGPDYVPGAITGTSPTIWYRDPFISDLQSPADETAVNALSSTPLTDKQITVGGQPGTRSAMLGSRYGERGRLVVNSTFAQGYTVSDVQCADAAGTPPCVYGPYDHAMVFTFSAPRACGAMQVGQVITGFSGGLSEFNGLTEIGFPQTFAECPGDNPIVDIARLPPPAQVDPETWFKSLTDPSGGMINFERNEAAPIQVVDGIVCDLDDDFDTFKQWKLAPGHPDGTGPTVTGGDCSGRDDVLNVITLGIPEIDPPSLVGQTVTVTGVLRPVNIGSFNVWIIFPRSTSDIELP